MQTNRRGAALALVGALGIASMVGSAPSLEAQVPPLVSTTTTSTAPPSSGDGSAQPSGSDLSEGSSHAPEGAPDSQGDGTAAPAGGIVVPPEAQRIINAVRRSGPSSNQDVLSRLDALRSLGMPED